MKRGQEDRGITETLGIWSPASGPPSWYADGSGTARTLEQFEVQQQAFREWMAAGGIIADVGGGTYVNTQPYIPQISDQQVAIQRMIATETTPPPIVTNETISWPVKDPGETAATKKDAAPPDDTCPPGFTAIKQSNGKFTCLQGGAPPPTKLPQTATGQMAYTSPFFLQTGGNATGGRGVSLSPLGSSSANLDLGGVIGAVGNVGCNLITNATARAACLALAGAVGGAISGGGNAGGQGTSVTPLVGGGTMTTGVQCPPGMVWNGQACVNPGVGGAIERILPGDVGRPDRVFQSAAGTMGAVAPISYQTVRRVCPKRYVLGIDNNCYPKPMIPRQLRKWVPDAKPLLTGGEVKTLRKAKGLTKKVRKLANQFAPRPKHASSSPIGRKRK